MNGTLCSRSWFWRDSLSICHCFIFRFNSVVMLLYFHKAKVFSHSSHIFQALQQWYAILISFTKLHLMKCMNHRTLAEMFNVQHTRSKIYRPGSEIPFHPNDLQLDMLRELIDLFTELSVFVRDPYCSRMTTLIAALRIGRSFAKIIAQDELHWRKQICKGTSLCTKKEKFGLPDEVRHGRVMKNTLRKNRAELL